MSYLLILVPIALGLGFVGLLTFMWCLKSGQFDDLEGSAVRILDEEQEEVEIPAEVDRSSVPNDSNST